MERSNIGDSSTGHSTQPTMSGNTRELATSLVEMKIASRDLSMLEAATFQGKDGQQPREDSTDPLNEDPPTVDLRDSKDSHEDPMNVDDLPTGPTVEAGAEVESVEDRAVDAEGQVEVCEEAPLTREGVSQKEQCDPSLRC